MESVRELDYSYVKAFLHPPGFLPTTNAGLYGTVELEIMGNKGCFNVQTASVSGFRERNPDFELEIFLSKESTGDKVRIGRINTDGEGKGTCRKTFIDTGLKAEKAEAGKMSYKFMLIATRYVSVEESAISRVLLEGYFKIPFEIRDERIVGFKKEAKVDKTANQLSKKRNPLFQKVEPFQPPIPNFVWWRISVQPSLDYSYLQQDYCPRRKTNKAVF